MNKKKAFALDSTGFNNATTLFSFEVIGVMWPLMVVLTCDAPTHIGCTQLFSILINNLI